MTRSETTGGWRPCTSDRHQLAEGARWHDGSLWYVDLLRGGLYRWSGSFDGPAETVLSLGMPLGAVAPTAGPGGGWVVAAGDGIALCAPGGPPEWLARPARRADRAMRMNDGVCDPTGRFWAGSMETGAAPGAGALYRTDTDGSVHQVLDGLTVPNGPVFSADGRMMYLADSAHGTITRHVVDPATGELTGSEPFACLAAHEGRPDGMALDDRGDLWVALWGGGEVRRYGPDGSLRRSLPMPTPHPSSVAFGGGRMFVTTARHRLERPGPLAGAVLTRPTGVTARPSPPFGITDRQGDITALTPADKP
ncbi:SMP-30/gluconolactonase/LRE family protein [Streptomyces bobili]|uniref:SMP-30/gluconolactonase/LRE family protein n=1 Tax=Streptomyces bobili TaxID=67280 RepID=UPI0033ECA946